MLHVTDSGFACVCLWYFSFVELGRTLSHSSQAKELLVDFGIGVARVFAFEAIINHMVRCTLYIFSWWHLGTVICGTVSF